MANTNSTAGPSRTRPKVPTTAVIDLTMSDEERPGPQARSRGGRATIRQSSVASIESVYVARLTPPPVFRKSIQEQPTMDRGKGKQVERGRTSTSNHAQVQAHTQDGTANGGTSKRSSAHLATAVPPAVPHKRTPTVQPSSHGLPTVNNRLMARGHHSPAISSPKKGRLKPLVASQIPHRPIAGSSQVASQQKFSLAPAGHHDTIPQSGQSSGSRPLDKTVSGTSVSSTLPKKSLLTASSHAQGRSGLTSLSTTMRQSGTSSGEIGGSKHHGTTRPGNPATGSVAMAKTISSNSMASNTTFGSLELRRKAQESAHRSHTSIGAARSISPTKRGDEGGSGLVPGPRPRQQVDSGQRGRDQTVKTKEESGATDQRGVKRKQSAAFGSHTKPDRPPGSKIIGRQRDLISSTEASRILSPGVLSTPLGRKHPASRPLARTDSLQSMTGATPTPASRPDPSPLVKRAPAMHNRRESLLKESTSARNPTARQPTAIPIPIEQASHPTSPRTTVDAGPRSDKKATYPIFAPGYQSTVVKKSPKRRRSKATISPEKNDQLDLTGYAVERDPSFKSHTRSRLPREDTTRDAEGEGEEAEVITRPKRARPAPGTYTVPSMDDPTWPSMPGTQTGDTPKKKKTAEEGSSRSLATRASTSGVPDQDLEQTHRQRRRSRSRARASALALARAPSGGPSSPFNPVPTAQDAAHAPSTPPPRRERTSTQTPRSIFKSAKSQVSRLKTPTPRLVRPATLTPTTPNDGPEEVEELLESVPPSPVPAKDADEDDVLAMFAEYEFDSPQKSQTSLKEPDPQIAIPTAAGHTPPNSATEPQIDRPASQRSALADTTEVNATPTIRSPLKIVKSPLLGPFPRRVKPIEEPQARNLVADIFANAEAADARRLEREAKKEERNRRINAIIEDIAQAGTEQLPANSITAALTSTTGIEEGKENDKSESSHAVDKVLPPPPIKSRLRVSSTGSNRIPSSTSTKPDPVKSRDDRAIKRSEPLKTLQPPPSAGEAFFAAQRKAARSKNIVRVGDADRMITAISRTVSPDKHDAQEGDSGSDMDEYEDGDRSLPDVSLSLLADNEEISELMDVAREMQESRRGSGRHSAVEDYEIFWSKKPVEEGIVLAKPNLVPETLPEEISSTLASILVPALTAAESEFTVGSGVSSIFQALVESDARRRSTLLANLIRTMNKSTSDRFRSKQIFQFASTIWAGLGARSDLAGDIVFSGVTARSDREEASSLVCRVISIAARKGDLDFHHAHFIISRLLLQSIDPGTSTALQRTIEDTLENLWSSVIVMSNIQEDSPGNMSINLALGVMRAVEPLPSSIKTLVLGAISHTTIAARSVARWYAAGLMIPDALNDLHREKAQQTPSVHLIMEGAERIITIMSSPDPDYDLIDDLVTCLYATLSDIQLLVDATPYNPTDAVEHHPIMDLWALITRIGHQLRIPGDDDLRMQVSHTKARLAQLAIILQMQFETAFARMKREKGMTKLGTGLKEGKDGQAMLAFSRDVSMSE